MLTALHRRRERGAVRTSRSSGDAIPAFSLAGQDLYPSLTKASSCKSLLPSHLKDRVRTSGFVASVLGLSKGVWGWSSVPHESLPERMVAMKVPEARRAVWSWDAPAKLLRKFLRETAALPWQRAKTARPGTWVYRPGLASRRGCVGGQVRPPLNRVAEKDGHHEPCQGERDRRRLTKSPRVRAGAV